MLSLATGVLFLSACGGGGGGGGGSNNNPPANNPPASVPENLADHALTLEVPDEDRRQIHFHSGNTWTETADGTQTQGTYSYLRQTSGGSAILTLHPAVATNASTSLSMNFQSTTDGTFTYTSGRTGQGTFQLVQIDDLPNEPEPPDNPPQEPNDGLAPTALDGRIMYGTRTFTSTGPVGQTHKYVFVGQTFEDTDPPEEAQGIYDWDPSGDTARLVLNYMSPSDFQGDKHELQMHFATTQRGTFTSTYVRKDGTVITINGDFEFE